MPAPCGPRLGSKVLLSTKPGVAVILGMPACWCDGGAGWRVTSVVVAPGEAWTTAGATGRGEENIKICGAHTIVENMRRGMSPKDAGMDALRRIARNFNNDMTRLRFMDMVYYILRKDGAYAGVSMWSNTETGKPRRFAIHDGTRRIEDCEPLFQGSAIDWPPADWQDAG